MPATITTTGPLIQILTADFNADNLPDIISINAASNVIPTPGVSIRGVTAQTFLNTSPGPLRRRLL